MERLGEAKHEDKITLAHLQLLPLITGVQTVTLEEFSSLDRTKFSPVLICKEEGPLTAAMEDEGIVSHYVNDLVRPFLRFATGKRFGSCCFSYVR